MASSPPGSPTNKKPPPSSSSSQGHHGHQRSSPTDIFANAKVVAEAARFSFSNQSDKVDKAAAAEAAEELLASASQYGKLGDKGLGSYVDQAETYLHKYHSSSNPTPHPSTAAAGGKKTAGSKTHEGGDDDAKAEEGGDGGGLGGYFKMAEGFLNKK